MKIETPTNLTIDGQNYAVADFSDKVQNLVAIRTEWQNDVQQERLALTKTEAAIRSLDVELAQLVGAELAAKSGAANDASAAE
jgi:hypothetical protein